MRKKPASWSREQEQIVIDHYADSTPNQMYELLDGQFDTRQIQHKAKKFGIKKNDSYRSAQGIDGNGKRIKGSVPWNKNIKKLSAWRKSQRNTVQARISAAKS